MRTPILCYHKVGEPHDRSLNVSARDFRRQVAFLTRRYRLIPLRDVYRVEGRCVVLTLDDAYACSTEPLLQAARDFDATGTVFPVTALVGDMSRWDGERARKLADWTALARLRDAGYEIGNHTHTHADLGSRPTACYAQGGMESAPAPSPWSEAEGGGVGRGSACQESGTAIDASQPIGPVERGSACQESGTERPTSEDTAHDFVMLSPSKHDPADGPPSTEIQQPAVDESMLRQPQHDVTAPSSGPPSPSPAEVRGVVSPERVEAPMPPPQAAEASDVVQPALRGSAAEEVAAAEREIEARLGIRPQTFAYPFGRYDDAAVRTVRARGYLAAVTVRYGIASDRHDPHLLPRILISYSDGLHGLLYKLYIRPLLQGRR